jgi:hypothetical protein
LTRYRSFEDGLGSKGVASAEALPVVTSRDHDAKKSQSRLRSAALRANRVNSIFDISPNDTESTNHLSQTK